MNKIISFAGQIANGKTLASSYLMKKLNDKEEVWNKAAFADAVKQVFMDICGVDRDFIEKWKRVESAPPGFKHPVRDSLKWLGDGCREQTHENIWINKLFKDCLNKNIIIDDVRYINELNSIKKYECVNVLVIRNSSINEDVHPSESQFKQEIVKLKNEKTGAIKNSIFDFLLKNDEKVEDLYYKIDDVLITLLKQRGIF